MIVGFYVVLWVEAKVLEEIKQEVVPNPLHECSENKSS